MHHATGDCDFRDDDIPRAFDDSDNGYGQRVGKHATEAEGRPNPSLVAFLPVVWFALRASNDQGLFCALDELATNAGNQGSE
jgi:hypothetical protein